MSFEKDSNFQSNAGISRVLFGDKKPLLPTELNEIQQIQNQKIERLIAEIVGDGINDLDNLTFDSTNNIVSLKSGTVISISGNLIHWGSATSYGISVGESLYLQVWEDTVSYSDTLKEEGNQQSSVIVDNTIMDADLNLETSRRKVLKYQIAKTVDSSKTNMTLCSLTTSGLVVEVGEFSPITDIISGVTAVGNSLKLNGLVAEEFVNNDNLFINPYFLNAVNNSGKTKWSTTGTTVNKWILECNTTTGAVAELVEGGLSLSKATEDTTYFGVYQTVSDLEDGVKYTLSFSVDGEVYSYTYTGKNYTPGGVKLADKVYTYYVQSGTSNANIHIRFFKDTAVVLEWAKLEVGAVVTPFVIPNLNIEKLKCGDTVGDAEKVNGVSIFYDVSQLGITSYYIPDIIKAMPNRSIFIGAVVFGQTYALTDANNSLPTPNGCLEIIRPNSTAGRTRVTLSTGSNVDKGHLYYCDVDENNWVINGWVHVGDDGNALKLAGFGIDYFYKKIVSSSENSTVDPNTTTLPRIRTLHSNCPTSTTQYIVDTIFTDSTAESYEKFQIAMTANGYTNVYVRAKKYGGSWSAWKNISDGGNASKLGGKALSSFRGHGTGFIYSSQNGGSLNDYKTEMHKFVFNMTDDPDGFYYGFLDVDVFDGGGFSPTSEEDVVRQTLTSWKNGQTWVRIYNANTEEWTSWDCSAEKLATERVIAITGDGTASGKFNGSADLSLALTLANSGVTAGSYGQSANASPAHSGSFTIPYITVDAKGRVTGIKNITITLPADNNTVYTHPTTSGNKHIPSGGSSGQILRWSADGTAVWGADNNTVYTHPNSGATAGTYRSVTVNAQGHVTAGSNPTVTVAQGGTGATTAAQARTNLGAQAALGFTPVQQGTGTGQLANIVKIGWSGSRLKATVDTTDMGNFVFDSHLASYRTKASGSVVAITTDGTTAPTDTTVLWAY